MDQQMKTIHKALYDSPIGHLVLVSDDQYLLNLYPASKLPPIPDVNLVETEPIYLAKQWLNAYFSGSSPDANTVPMRLNGTPFQVKCWQQLLLIPYGSTTTYKAIAKELAKHSATGKMSCQAVGQAIGRNPIAIIVPCHRVIGSDGTLTGYAGGLELKKKLLIHEQSIKAAL